MNKKEESPTDTLDAIQLVKELQLFIDCTLIPGEIRPAIFWLKQRSTKELRAILFYNAAQKNTINKDNPESEDDRVMLMKRILLFYYPECDALAIKRGTSVSTN